MELSEKIQKLRRDNNLTQEQFAEIIFVSRTAVSKWETGRGIPSIDSLQMIAKEFDVRLDYLLSTEEIAEMAKLETESRIKRFSDFVVAIANACALLALILPLYKIDADGIFYSTYIGNIGGWQGIVLGIISPFITLCGILQAVFLFCDKSKIEQALRLCALAANVFAILLCILSLQPYPAIFYFVLFMAKGILMIKSYRHAK